LSSAIQGLRSRLRSAVTRAGARRRVASLLSIGLALGFAASASAFVLRSEKPAPPTRPPPLTAIVGVTVVDVVTGEERPRQTVILVGGRIDRIGSRLAVPTRARRVAGSGRFLIPGLWDMHTHHQATGEASLPLFVANGVVGTRDMGSDLAFILPLRQRTRDGSLLGPKIVAAGPILDAAPADWPFRRHVGNAAEARVAVRDLKRAGVDFIKVHDQTPRDAFFAIADESAKLGIPFAGHVPSSVTVDEAAASGMASIEHLANYRIFLECSGDGPYSFSKCRPLFDKLASNHVWQTPTLAFFETIPDLFSGKPPLHFEYASPGLRELWRKNQEGSKLSEASIAFLRGAGRSALTAVKDMRGRGVQFLAGCDGLVPGFCLQDELEWLTRAGLTPLEALQAATINPARYLKRDAAEGSIQSGKAADLVLLGADPLADIRNIRTIEGVFLNGRYFDRAELDRLIAHSRCC